MNKPGGTHLKRVTLTVDETAAVLGTSRTGAYRAIHRGDIPARRIGRKFVIPRAALNAYLQGDVPAEHAATESASDTSQ